MTLLDRQKEFTGYLVAGFPKLKLAGIPLKSACAVTGNATQENLVKAVTKGPKDHGSDGTLQWRLDRLDGPHGLKGWAAAQGLDWATLSTQAAFFLWELNRDYPALENDLRKGTKPIKTLTANICKFYERPSSEEYIKKYRNPKTGEMESLLDRRIEAAESIFKVMSEEANVPTATKVGGGAAVVIGGLTAANHASGGDAFWTIAGGIMTLVAAIGGPVVSQWIKSRKKAASASPLPSKAPVDDLATALVELEKAIEVVKAEQAKLNLQVETFKEEIAAADKAVDEAVTVSKRRRLVGMKDA